MFSPPRIQIVSYPVVPVQARCFKLRDHGDYIVINAGIEPPGSISLEQLVNIAILTYLDTQL